MRCKSNTNNIHLFRTSSFVVGSGRPPVPHPSCSCSLSRCSLFGKIELIISILSGLSTISELKITVPHCGIRGVFLPQFEKQFRKTSYTILYILSEILLTLFYCISLITTYNKINSIAMFTRYCCSSTFLPRNEGFNKDLNFRLFP
mgnify:CR=1 FL=1